MHLGVYMKKIIVLILVLIANISFAENMKSAEETRNLADKMINKFVKKEFQQGLALAKAYWPLPEVEIDGLANQIKTQWPIVDQRFGKTTGQEFIKKEKIGDSFIRYYYLHKFQNHAIYWKFTFYKPSNKWVVNGVQFLDTLDVLYKTVQ